MKCHISCDTCHDQSAKCDTCRSELAIYVPENPLYDCLNNDNAANSECTALVSGKEGLMEDRTCVAICPTGFYYWKETAESIADPGPYLGSVIG
jgi:hypothetical protein